MASQILFLMYAFAAISAASAGLAAFPGNRLRPVCVMSAVGAGLLALISALQLYGTMPLK